MTASRAQKYQELCRRAGVVSSICIVVFFFFASTASLLEHPPGWFGIVAGVSSLTGIVSSSICIVAGVVGSIKSKGDKRLIQDA
jgi:hypothetical protein